MDPATQGAGRVRRRWLRIVGGIGLVFVLGLACAELILQIASLVAPDRSGSWRASATTRILCVGDSHTWGAGVEREESYPGELQHFLDLEKPGFYSVMNLGLPGMSTTQLRNRITVWLSRYQPDLLIVWVGVNNAWNTAEMEEEPGNWQVWLDRRLIGSRLYRLVRVRMHDRELEHYAHEAETPDVWRIDHVERKLTRDAAITVKHDGVIETIRHHGSEQSDESQIEPRALPDLREIARLARAADVDPIFINYPLTQGWFNKANNALWRVSQEYEIPLVRSGTALQRVPREKREWLWASHPGAAIYREIARDVAKVVLGAGS